MYYCTHCNKVFEPEAYVNFPKIDDQIVLCPIKGCRSQILDIDEAFIPIIRELYCFDIKTLFCCSGHSWQLEDGTVDIYLVYDYEHMNEDGFLEIFTEQLKELSEEDIYSFINVHIINEEKPRTYIDIDGNVHTTSTVVDVCVDMPSLKDCVTPLEEHSLLLLRQAEFVNAINTALKNSAAIVVKRQKLAIEIDTELDEAKELDELLNGGGEFDMTNGGSEIF